MNEVTGYIYTHWDCSCGMGNEEEGHVTHEEVECVDCGEKARIS